MSASSSTATDFYKLRNPVICQSKIIQFIFLSIYMLVYLLRIALKSELSETSVLCPVPSKVVQFIYLLERYAPLLALGLFGVEVLPPLWLMRDSSTSESITHTVSRGRFPDHGEHEEFQRILLENQN